MTSGKYLLAPLLLSTALAAQANTPSDSEFQACIDRLGSRAAQQGVSQSVIDSSLMQVSFNPRVIELDRQQPEFTTTFADYFNRRVNTQRIIQGRTLLALHRKLLDDIAQKYGVPPQYLVAFWGLETNYGSYFGRMSVLDSLATLACDPRRSDYFSGELLSALRIVDEGAITAERMEGSWAGAMGHVQFMPSVFLRYAVDYDGDGKRDLWGSLPDAMASAANFLSGIGWEKEERWGREVRLPDNFPYTEAGRSTRKSLEEWHRLGVRQTNGNRLPQADMQASLLVPSGHRGPAFLVYQNFDVIMRWNRSEFYALSVGHLADRINGAGPLYRSPPEDVPRLHRDQVLALQKQLNDKGFDSGTPDGIMGPATRSAISAFQNKAGMTPDGFPDIQTLNALGISISSENQRGN